MRYYIEQAQDRFYDPNTLAAAKSRAKAISKKSGGIAYIIAERFSTAARDYEAVGSIAYANGMLDAVEGEVA